VADCDVHAWVIAEALSYQGEPFHSLEHKNIPGTVVASRPRRSGERQGRVDSLILVCDQSRLECA
jgi:hypothetical protein